MPDILIRGMEMPQSCAKCDLFGEYGCAFIGSVGYALTENRRSDDCPLHELPPHGELHIIEGYDQQQIQRWRLL